MVLGMVLLVSWLEGQGFVNRVDRSGRVVLLVVSVPALRCYCYGCIRGFCYSIVPNQIVSSDGRLVIVWLTPGYLVGMKLDWMTLDGVGLLVYILLESHFPFHAKAKTFVLYSVCRWHTANNLGTDAKGLCQSSVCRCAVVASLFQSENI